eukprot:m.6002 g.6002  ORF g.6002 m.6002 type:complete len:441 (+) comp4836_c0_seq1:101-1423(+)
MSLLFGHIVTLSFLSTFITAGLYTENALPYRVGGWPANFCNPQTLKQWYNLTRCSDPASFNVYMYDLDVKRSEGETDYDFNGKRFWTNVMFNMPTNSRIDATTSDNGMPKHLMVNFTSNADDACLFVPSIPYDCFENRCDFGDDWNEKVLQGLQALPHWDGGRNHVLFTTSDFEVGPYGLAMRAHAGSELQEFRPCLDVAFPCFNVGQEVNRLSRIQNSPMLNPKSFQRTMLGDQGLDLHKTKYFLTFKGSRYPYHGPDGDWCNGARVRDRLSELHDPTRGVVVVTKCKDWGFALNQTDAQACKRDLENYNRYEYDDLTNTTFGLVPRGCGPSSYRLLEMLGLGVIPVVLQDGVVLPFMERLHWHEFAVIVPESSARSIPVMLATMSAARIKAMRVAGRRAYLRHLQTPTHIMASTIATLKQRMLALARMTKHQNVEHGT